MRAHRSCTYLFVFPRTTYTALTLSFVPASAVADSTNMCPIFMSVFHRKVLEIIWFVGVEMLQRNEYPRLARTHVFTMGLIASTAA